MEALCSIAAPPAELTYLKKLHAVSRSRLARCDQVHPMPLRAILQRRRTYQDVRFSPLGGSRRGPSLTSCRYEVFLRLEQGASPFGPNLGLR